MALDGGVVTKGHYVHRILLDYKTSLEEMQMMPQRMPVIVHVRDDAHQDPYFYIYTNGMHNHGRRPELLAAVDMEMARGVKTHGSNQNQLDGTFDMKLENVYKYEGEGEGKGEQCWVVPIPGKT